MLRRLALGAVAALIASVCLAAPPTATPSTHPGADVTLAGRPVLRLSVRVGSFSPAARAAAVKSRLERLARDTSVPIGLVGLAPGDGATDIVAGDQVLLTVTDADATAAGKSRNELAAEWLASIRDELQRFRGEHNAASWLAALVYSLVATLALLVLLVVMRRLFRRFRAEIATWHGTRLKGVRIQKLELISAKRMVGTLLAGTRLLQLAVWLGLLLTYASLEFSFFPATRLFVRGIIGQVGIALKGVGAAALSYVPSVIYLLVVAAIAWAAVKFFGLIFEAIESRNVVIPGFFPDWARPTFKIARFFIILVAAIAMFPYVPGSNSPAFRGISIFIGAVVSLGSSSAVSNILAGVVLTYTRAFQIGDRVQIGDAVGDIVGKTLLVTRIRTIKNVEVTIPNSQVLGSQVSNFTSRVSEGGLILHTTVTIGYDAPWRRVHELLIAAAKSTPGVLADPEPFVLQMSLDDFFVSYQVNAHTDQPRKMVETLAALHANIQDAFNRAGVEICSPHFRALRDGNQSTIPRNGHAES
jgi:small-conductance mechanosensitive channel